MDKAIAHKNRNIQSIQKAFFVINCLSKAGQALSLKEISLRTAIPKSTIHGIISTLKNLNAISQDNNGNYRLGSILFEYGAAVERQWNIVEIAKPFLQELCSQTNQSTGIAVLDNESALILYSVDAINPLRVTADSGSRLPLHASSAGKILLSSLSETELELVIEHTGSIPYTPHTITKLEEIKAQCNLIKEQGYATENGEMRIGMRSVASAIYNKDHKIKYAVFVTGMFRKITDQEFIDAIKLTTKTAQEISKKIQ